MQLASLLPGIRDLRAPLAGGMLWLVFGWFLLHALADDAYALAAEWPWSSFTPLFSDIGAGGIIVAASFAAYVIGATVVDPVNSWIRRTSVMVVLHIDTFMGVRSLYLALFRSHRSKVRSLQGQIHGVSTAFIWAQVRTLSFASADVWEFIRRCADALDVREKDLHNDLGLDCDLLGDALHYAAVPEYEQLGDRLLVEQSTLFAAVDRLRAMVVARRGGDVGAIAQRCYTDTFIR
jgi:hypothetical protein